MYYLFYELRLGDNARLPEQKGKFAPPFFVEYASVFVSHSSFFVPVIVVIVSAFEAAFFKFNNELTAATATFRLMKRKINK